MSIELRDDADNLADASERARRMRMDPSILAVIGHSRSGTTLATLPYYASAGIPVLMPSSTSPYVPYNFDLNGPWPDVDEKGRITGAKRFQRVFRLPPKDVPDQVGAITATTLKLLPKKTASANKEVMLVCDVTKGSDVYAKPICDALLHNKDLSPHISSYRKFDLDTGDVYGIVTEIHAVKARFIIVIAYPQVARALLEEIKERAPQVHEKISNYTFILSDSCMTAAHDLLGFGARIFITSPSQIIGDQNAITDVLVRHIAEKNVSLTEECYTFDAILMIIDAVKSESCKEEISRSCIAESLQKANHLGSGCGQYHFVDGESENASYHVFTGCKDKLSDIGTVEKNHAKPPDIDISCKEK